MAKLLVAAILLCALNMAIIGTAIAADQDHSAKPPNVLFIIGDDMGDETLKCFGLSDNTAKTPTLDNLCRKGVRFDNFWSQPVCSPTRATLITGRYGFRTGVGRPTGDGASMGYFPELPPKPASAPAEDPFSPPMRKGAPTDFGLPLNELALPMVIKASNGPRYNTAAIGKWHLADRRNGWVDNPNIVGFDHFAGLIRGFPSSYFAWNKAVDGKWSGQTGYTPNDKAKDAIQWLDEQQGNPWFLWFAFNLPHNPLHLPPADLLNSDYSNVDPKESPAINPMPHYHAMLEAMDTEIAKVLDSIPPDVLNNTYVIFIGDNGTANNVVSKPFEKGRAKGTIYQGGVNVPLIVNGPGVSTGVSKALVNSTDLFSTILEMIGIDRTEMIPENLTLDSVSIVPYLHNPDLPSIRKWAYVDNFAGNFAGVAKGDYAMRNAEFKLLRHRGNLEFYNLKSDPYESKNLLNGKLTETEQAQFDALSKQIMDLRSSH